MFEESGLFGASMVSYTEPTNELTEASSARGAACLSGRHWAI